MIISDINNGSGHGNKIGWYWNNPSH